MHEPKLCWWTTKVGEKISPLKQKDVYIKEKQRFLDHFFDPGTPYTFLPNTCHLCQTSCSAFSSLRKTYGKKTLHGGESKAAATHEREDATLVWWFQYGSNLGDFLSYQTGLSAFDVNFCLHTVTSLQMWSLFLSGAESHLIDDLFMTSFTACCKWSPWMFKVFDRVTKKRRSPDLLLKQKNAHPISWTIKKATSVWAPLPCRKWWPPEMACETVKLSTLWGFFWGLGSLGECFCWRVVHLNRAPLPSSASTAKLNQKKSGAMKRHSLRHGAEMSPLDFELFKQRVLGDVSKSGSTYKNSRIQMTMHLEWNKSYQKF